MNTLAATFPDIAAGAPKAPEPAAAEAPAPAAPPARGAFPLLDRLLRGRADFLRTLEDEAALAPVARAMLLAIAVSTAAFGAVLGFYRGGWQVLFAAVKLPLVVLLTAGLVAPVLSALQFAHRGRAQVRRDFALVLVALAFGSVVLAGLAPVLVLATMVEAGYHALVVLAVAACGIAGAAGLALLWRGLRASGGIGRAGVAVVLLVCALVGSRMSWTFRPFLVRPRSEVVFLRPVEGSFAGSVSTSWDSARGRYHRDEAPLPARE